MISFAALRDGDWPMPPDDAIAFVAGMLPDRELRERVRLALEQGGWLVPWRCCDGRVAERRLLR